MATEDTTSAGAAESGQGDVSGADVSAGTTPETTTDVTTGDVIDGGEAGGAQDDGTASDSATGADGAPESYADFVMPEGVEVDAALLEKAGPMFKEIGLSQDQAQMVVNLHAEQVEAMVTGQVEAFNQQVTDWEAAAKTDKEFGGDKFDENLSVAKVGMDKLATPELKDFLETTGAGSHPEMMRLFYRVGQLMKEDAPAGGNPTVAPKDRVSLLYPDT